MKYLFRISAITNFVVAGFTCLIALLVTSVLAISDVNFMNFAMVALGVIAFLVFSGVLYLNYAKSSAKDLQESRGIILILGVLTLFTNVISGVLLLLAFNQISVKGESKIRKKINTDNSFLIKVGVILIILAGLAFATTDLGIVSGLFKSLSLLLIGLTLIIISYGNFKVKANKVTYWVLGVVVLLLSFLTIGTYGVLGSWFAIGGDGQSLFFALFTLIATLLSYLTYSRFEDSSYIPVVVLGALATMGLTLSCIGLQANFIFLIIASLILLFNVICGNPSLVKVSNLFTIALSFIVMIDFLFVPFEGYLIPVLTTLILVLDLVYYLLTNKKIGLINIFVIALLIGALCINLGPVGMLATVLGYTFIYLILLVKNGSFKNRLLPIAFTVVFNLVLFILFLINFNDNLIMSLLIGFLLLLPTTVNNYIKPKSLIEYYSIPLKLIIFTMAAIFLLDKYIAVSSLFAICICYFVMLFGYYTSKDKNLKKVFFSLFGILLLTAIFKIDASSQDIPALIVLLSSCLPVMITLEGEEPFYKKLSLVSFVILLGSIYHILTSIGLFGRFDNLIVIIAYLALAFIYRKRHAYLLAAEIMLIFPLVNYLGNPNCIYPWDVIIKDCIIFYIIFLIADNLAKSDATKNIIYIIALAFTLLALIFEGNLVTGLFVLVITAILMFVGIQKDQYQGYFITGFVFLVIDGIYILSDMWFIIPLWMYLLIGGLIIIAYVTYRNNKK